METTPQALIWMMGSSVQVFQSISEGKKDKDYMLQIPCFDLLLHQLPYDSTFQNKSKAYHRQVMRCPLGSYNGMGFHTHITLHSLVSFIDYIHTNRITL